MLKNKLWNLILIAWLFLFVGCGHAQSQGTCDGVESTKFPDEPITIALEKYIGAFRKAEVTIGGQAHPFLFDTGGGVTVVGTKIAELIGCEPFGQMTAFNLKGTRIDMKKCPQTDLQIGPFRATRDLAYLDIQNILPEGVPPISGLISLQTFENQAITLDLNENKIIIESEESLKERVSTMEEMRIFLDRGVDNSILDIYVEVPTAKGPLWFILDSGNLAGFLINPHAFEQLGIQKSGVKQAGEEQKQDVELEIPGLGRVQTPIIVQDIVLDGAISAEFMEQLVLTMDLGAQRMWGKIKK